MTPDGPRCHACYAPLPEDATSCAYCFAEVRADEQPTEVPAWLMSVAPPLKPKQAKTRKKKPAPTPESKLAARIADNETQYRHLADERLRCWVEARRAGWSFGRIGEAAGVKRNTVYYTLKRAEERGELEGMKRAGVLDESEGENIES